MRKTVTILVLVVVLCAIITSCKKPNIVLKPRETRVEDPIGPNEGKAKSAPVSKIKSQNKILFTARKTAYTNIIKLDTKTKTKQIIASFPIKPINIVISPDLKKAAFLVKTKLNEEHWFDLYTINMDGSNLVNITLKVLSPEQKKSEPSFCFSPDNEQILIKCTSYTKGLFQYSIYTSNIDGSKGKLVPIDDPNFIIFDQVILEICRTQISAENNSDEIFFKKEDDGTIKVNSEKMEYLINNKSMIGIFSWKTKIFTPLVENLTIPFVFSWTPDWKNVLYAKKVIDKDCYDICFFDLQSKKEKTISTSVAGIFKNMLWLPGSKSFIYANFTGIKKGVSTVDGKEVVDNRFDKYLYDLIKIDLEPKSSLVLLPLDSIDGLTYLSENIIVCEKSWYEGHWKTLINLQTKKEENLPYDQYDLDNSNSTVVGNNLLFLTRKSIFFFNTIKNQLEEKYIFSKAVQEFGTIPKHLTFSPEYSNFYFVMYDQLFIFSSNGELLQIEKLNPSMIDQDEYYHHNTSFIIGFFLSSSVMIYLENIDSDVDRIQWYEYSLPTKEVSLIDQPLKIIKAYKVSSDRKKVAILSIDQKENMYYVDIDDFQSKKSSQRIASFPVPEKYGGPLVNYPNPDILHSLFWSLNSQFLYFVEAGPTHLAKEDVINTLFINRVKADGSGLINLTNPKGLAYQASLSPDGKKIVYINGEKQEIAIMNPDGTDKETINPVIQSSIYWNCNLRSQPVWLLDSKHIGYYETDLGGIGCCFFLVNVDNKSYRSIPTPIENTYEISEEFNPLDFFSFDGKYGVLKLDLQDKQQSAIYLIEGVKVEIPLKGNIVSFRWSPTGNQLLLLESKAEYEINQLTLYDCSTNSYAPISQDVQQIFDVTWSRDGKQILYSGTDSKTGQIVFKTSNPDGSNQKVLFTFGENPLERPSSIEKIEKLVWLK